METIDFFQWVKSHQKAELNLTKRSHMASVIKYSNLIARQLRVGIHARSALDAPKSGVRFL